MTYEERLQKIVDIGYEIICYKIANGSVEIENEASFQLQLSVVLQAIGKQFEFNTSDRFSLVLEKKYTDVKTAKSTNGNARCDIYMKFEDIHNEDKTKSVIVELKFLREKEASTDHRFSVLMDIENCEKYYEKDDTLSLAYCIVCCTETKYSTKQKCSFSIGDGDTIKKDTYQYRKQEIQLNHDYNFSWNKYGDFQFMKLMVKK